MTTHNAIELNAQMIYDGANSLNVGELGLTPREFVSVLATAASHKQKGGNVLNMFEMMTGNTGQLDIDPQIDTDDEVPSETADDSPNLNCVYSLAGLVTRIARKPDNTWDFASLQADMIKSELDEMFLAIKERNLEEYFDSAHDIIFLTTALAYMHGHDYLTGYQEMVQALMSRFDTSLANAEQTRQKYSALGVSTYNRCVNIPGLGQRWVTYVAEEVTIGKEHYPANKWLKSRFYHKPVYTNLPTLV